MREGWWILVDRDGLIISGEGQSKEDMEYFAAIIAFAVNSLLKAIREELGSGVSEISLKVPDRRLVLHILPMENNSLFLITAMPEDMPLGLIRLHTKEIYDRVKTMVKTL